MDRAATDQKIEKSEVGDFVPQYDVMSTERYVDSTSQKSEFDRVLDELGRISQETLAWDILRLTRKHFGDREEDKARKFEAFMGAFITNAATALYDKGLVDEAFKRLEQARSILEAKQKLCREIEIIRSKAELEVFDVSDMLGFGEGDESE
ncbi:MAG: hypothetical protein LBJ36_03795 [Synergistaceae bacterium]|nr:hypothetical protein [Synergistaceae bacterium]